MVRKYVTQIAEWMEQCSERNTYNKLYPSRCRSHCPNTQARTGYVLPGLLLMEIKNKTSKI
jgi:hypothetical protein